jgi:hypothetical protein
LYEKVPTSAIKRGLSRQFGEEHSLAAAVVAVGGFPAGALFGRHLVFFVEAVVKILVVAVVEPVVRILLLSRGGVVAGGNGRGQCRPSGWLPREEKRTKFSWR